MTEGKRPTLEDLQEAKADVAHWDDAWANDSSNNPNKFSSHRRNARRRLHELTAQLKAQGDLESTDHERLCATLDTAAPKARSGQVVDHDGARYRRRF